MSLAVLCGLFVLFCFDSFSPISLLPICLDFVFVFLVDFLYLFLFPGLFVWRERKEEYNVGLVGRW